ncbi:uncharacterized protein [Dipodomys merriami]|uniref:uncharacterized protein n=1 Tax=Dipodomys merriami TaxID=94247 RepID=UPI003855B9CF
MHRGGSVQPGLPVAKVARCPDSSRRSHQAARTTPVHPALPPGPLRQVRDLLYEVIYFPKNGSQIGSNDLPLQRSLLPAGFRSVVVITFASHAKGPRFETGRKHELRFFFSPSLLNCNKTVGIISLLSATRRPRPPGWPARGLRAEAAAAFRARRSGSARLARVALRAAAPEEHPRLPSSSCRPGWASVAFAISAIREGADPPCRGPGAAVPVARIPRRPRGSVFLSLMAVDRSTSAGKLCAPNQQLQVQDEDLNLKRGKRKHPVNW